MKILIKINLIAIALIFANGDINNSVKILRTRCIITDPTEITCINCRTVSINRTYSVAQIHLYLTKPLNNIIVNVQLFKKTDVKFRPFLLNIKEDFCAFSNNKNKGNIYLRRLYRMHEPYSNLNHSCPYEGDIIFKDIPMDASLLPSIWPSGGYRVDLHAFNFDVKKFTIEVRFELKELRNRPTKK